jgi:hypothetical protein
MAWGFECGDGWFEILWRLCVDLEPLVTGLERDTGEQFEVVQVKQKLGTLRFYVSHHTDSIDERIGAAAGHIRQRRVRRARAGEGWNGHRLMDRPTKEKP